MKVAVAGLGYVGLTTALGFCAVGHTVLGVDTNRSRVEALSSGRVPFLEPGLEPLLREHLASGKFRAETTYGPAIGACEVAMIAVNTPQTSTGAADLQFLQAAARALASVRREYQVVVVRSTAPPDALSIIRAAFAESGAAETVDFDVAANPEFLREGHALDDFARPHRIVLGAGSRRAVRLLEDLYRPLVERLEPPPPILVMRPESAMLAKYAANAFLAARVALINEVADIAGRAGADIREVARAMGLDPRIGPHYLAPGPGFGGPCLPKDVQALAALARACGVRPHLLEGALARNREQALAIVRLVEQAAGGVAGRTVAVWGLAFKAGIDDLRDSPAVAVVGELLRKGANVRAHDPAVLEADRPELDGISLWKDPLEAADGADVLVVLTEWGQFREADFADLRARMTRPRIVDARLLLDRERLFSLGFEVWSVGVAGPQGEA